MPFTVRSISDRQVFLMRLEACLQQDFGRDERLLGAALGEIGSDKPTRTARIGAESSMMLAALSIRPNIRRTKIRVRTICNHNHRQLQGPPARFSNRPIGVSLTLYLETCYVLALITR
jgi:hypothetical protein